MSNGVNDRIEIIGGEMYDGDGKIIFGLKNKHVETPTLIYDSTTDRWYADITHNMNTLYVFTYATIEGKRYEVENYSTSVNICRVSLANALPAEITVTRAAYE